MVSNCTWLFPVLGYDYLGRQNVGNALRVSYLSLSDEVLRIGILDPEYLYTKLSGSLTTEAEGLRISTLFVSSVLCPLPSAMLTMETGPALSEKVSPQYSTFGKNQDDAFTLPEKIFSVVRKSTSQNLKIKYSNHKHTVIFCTIITGYSFNDTTKALHKNILLVIQI